MEKHLYPTAVCAVRLNEPDNVCDVVINGEVVMRGVPCEVGSRLCGHLNSLSIYAALAEAANATQKLISLGLDPGIVGRALAGSNTILSALHDKALGTATKAGSDEALYAAAQQMQTMLGNMISGTSEAPPADAT